ncbi:MAG: site-specific DNA-methyltransferase [Candidatus Thermoplasmatota archaeon]|nr:site-specific DNA-methyltransferase [Candidatus Thermoplasmatota archaeon]
MDGMKGRLIIGDSRKMNEIDEGSKHLIITSPPYWDIKDYMINGQIGRGSDLHTYLKDLYLVWEECFRVLVPGRRLVINIGDQFTRTRDYGRYKVVPLHAEMIIQCERLGFDFIGSIIWQKRTTLNTTGGAPVMGSYPYPPNGIVELDHEHIMIFKKPGKEGPKKFDKEGSKLSKEEWKEYFSGHWTFKGARQADHEAVFPEELPRRLIRMFSFVGEEVLDPFLGSGTTMKASLDLDRSCTGYELNMTYIPIIKEKVGQDRFLSGEVSIFERPPSTIPCYDEGYLPSINNMEPSKKDRYKKNKLNKVEQILDPLTLVLSDGNDLELGGIRILHEERAISYLNEHILGREVMFKPHGGGGYLVYLKNRIFINRYMVRSGVAEDLSLPKGRR